MSRQCRLWLSALSIGQHLSAALRCGLRHAESFVAKIKANAKRVADVSNVE